MKKVQTLSILESSLQEELGWRRKELSSLYLSALSAKAGSEAEFRAIRSGIVLSYAHLEGFCVAAVRLYLSFVRCRNLKYSELAPSFLALKMSKMVNEATTKVSYYAEAAALFTSKMMDQAELPEPETLTAASNLNFERFNELLQCVAIGVDEFALKERFFDVVLLERRNAIAHGEFRRPSLSDYREVHCEIVEIIDLINESVVSAAIGRRYSKA